MRTGLGHGALGLRPGDGRDTGCPNAAGGEGLAGRQEEIFASHRLAELIIVGGSFAGLAVASRLRGRVLLIDTEEIGEGQTSACGTLLNVPRRLGLMDSVLQAQDALIFHLRDRVAIMDVLNHRFCAFDYWRFCRACVGPSPSVPGRGALGQHT